MSYKKLTQENISKEKQEELEEVIKEAYDTDQHK
jgi:hypothetical protein